MSVLVDSVAEPTTDPLAGDRLKLVRFVAPHYEAARPIVLADLTTPDRHIAQGGSPQLVPGERDRGNIRIDAPWVGEVPTLDRHGNARLSFTLRLMASDAVADADAIVAAILTAPSRCAIEWRRGGRPTYFPLRGDADWTPGYSMRERRQGGGMTVAFSIEVAPWSHRGSMDVADDFAVDSLADYTFDVGAGGLSVSGGQLAQSSTATQRLYHSARGYRYGDSQVTFAFTPGGAVGTPFHGVIIKRLGPDDYLLARYQGTGLVRLYRVDGGVYTMLTSTVITALTAGVKVWLRGRIQGDTLAIEHFTTTPTPLGDATRTGYTLVGAEATKFGAGVVGDVGLELSGGDVADRFDDFRAAPYTYRRKLLPAHIALGGKIPGDLSALCDLHVSSAEGGANAPVFGLFGWSRRPVSAVYQAPLGILEGEAAATLTTFAVAGNAGVTHGGSYAATGTAGAGAGLIQWLVDSDALGPDEDGTVSVDVFARVLYDNTHTGLKWVLHADPSSGISRGPRRYGDRGPAGLTAVAVTASSWRFLRLGRIRLGGSQRLGVDVSWSAGTGTLGLDYALVVPSRLFTASPQDVANDDAYPDLFPSTTAEVTRMLMHDGGAFSRPAGQNPLRDHGMGRRIELPPGGVDLISKLSTLVPGDPTVNAASEQLEHTATLHARVLPRFVYT